MSRLEMALAAWIAFHASIGVDVKPTLQPPAEEHEIRAVENQIGFKLPDDLRELYLIANGQLSPFDDREELLKRLSPNELWAPLFGYFQFLSLDQALVQYNYQLAVFERHKAFNDKYNKLNLGREIEPIYWDIRDDDPVSPLGWNHKWFMFAKTMSDGYSIDMVPEQGGTHGQVVENGQDVAPLKVIASSVTELLETATLKLDPQEASRYGRSSPEYGKPIMVFFNMDWQYSPYDDQVERDAVSIVQPDRALNDRYKESGCLDADECEVPIDRNMARELAHMYGLEQGLKEWEIDIHWYDRYQSYVWIVSNTLSESRYESEGDSYIIDAFSGKFCEHHGWGRIQ